jgi:hypothetical protein
LGSHLVQLSCGNCIAAVRAFTFVRDLAGIGAPPPLLLEILLQPGDPGHQAGAALSRWSGTSLAEYLPELRGKTRPWSGQEKKMPSRAKGGCLGWRKPLREPCYPRPEVR